MATEPAAAKALADKPTLQMVCYQSVHEERLKVVGWTWDEEKFILLARVAESDGWRDLIKIEKKNVCWRMELRVGTGVYDHTCANCGKAFVTKVATQINCSAKCTHARNQRAHRKRKRAAEKEEATSA